MPEKDKDKETPGQAKKVKIKLGNEKADKAKRQKVKKLIEDHANASGKIPPGWAKRLDNDGDIAMTNAELRDAMIEWCNGLQKRSE